MRAVSGLLCLSLPIAITIANRYAPIAMSTQMGLELDVRQNFQYKLEIVH